ncbi:rab-GTPase-TBC domain-containing protein [Terfezia claveryi]|nr:rab-GTPase-TBC domain-containing protein [Terfezia claveryi]
MRSLQESRQRWREFKAYNSKDSLKHDILRKQLTSSPCGGIRSLCWKLFLYLPDFAPPTWSPVLASSRDVFTTLRAKLLGPLESGNIGINDEDPDHPIDPLAEGPSNPWSQLRKDEELRREIIQDVERCMPDHDYFRSEKVQKQLLDVLFVYCKLNADMGYRQGMHEIVAPILWVVDNDAVQADFEEILENEKYMLEALDPAYVEHDTFSLFQAVMHSARPWYELGEDSDDIRSKGNSPIVEKSRMIHENLLMAVDPQLARHLKELEVLPQVFLIRWIRLLFGREFPFDQLLVLWDSLFAEDPDFTLVDYICVAMLLRIRWELLEFDYSMTLTLLLRYPAPKHPNLPATFVSDAIYLRNHLDLSGGAYIISKYSNRTPASVPMLSPPQSPPTSPSRRGFRPSDSPVRRTMSPIAGQTARTIPSSSGLDRLVNDLAKGVVGRSKGWGLGKPIERLMEELQWNKPFENVADRAPSPETVGDIRRKKKAEMKERNEILQEALEKSYMELQVAVGERPELRNALHRIQLVQVCLHDSGIRVDRSLFKDVAPPPTSGEQHAGDGRNREEAVEIQDLAPMAATVEPPLPPAPQEPKIPITPSPLQVFSQSSSYFPPLPQSPLPLPPLSPPRTMPSSSSPFSPTLNPQPQSPLLPPHISSPPPPPPLKREKRTLITPTPTTTTTISSHQLSNQGNLSFPTTTLTGTPESVYTHKARSGLAQSGFAWILGEKEDQFEVRDKEAFGGVGGLFGDGSGGGVSPRSGGGLFGGDEGDGEVGPRGQNKRRDRRARAMLFGEE